MTDAMEFNDTRAVTGSTVRPDALLGRTGRARTSAGLRAAASEAMLRRLLNRCTTDRLEVVAANGDRTVYGEADTSADTDAPARAHRPLGSLSGSITVLDDRAWTAVLAEGSIGLGRGYLEGWWTSDDPTTVVRIIIRNLRPLDELRNRLDRVGGRVGDRIRRLRPHPDRTRNRDDIASHYDLGNDFFALFLDETMTYSSGVFPTPEADLHTASLTKYDRLAAKLDIRGHHHILEIGTGWGGFALRVAETTGCRVTTTTISAEQRREALERVRKAGLSDRVEVLDADWRDLRGCYDRVVSIEMIEAVDWRHYDQYFATIDRCLRPDGLVGIQAICVPDRRWERAKNTEDFIRRFVFPGGYLPSIGAIGRALAQASHLQIVDVEDFTAHYSETLRRWRERFDANLDEVRRLGLDGRFVRLWRFYLAYCEAGFRERHCSANQFVMAGPQWRSDGLTLRPL